MSITMHVDEAPTRGLDADGRPDPAYAAALGLRSAAPGKRSAAFAIDAAIWSVLAIPGAIGAGALVGALLSAPGDPSTVAATRLDLASLVLPLVLIGISQVLLTAFGLTQLILHGRRGVTVGKASLGLRSVNIAGFDRPGFWRVVLRALVLWAAQVVLPFVGPGVLFASGLWDPQQRGRSWLDRIGRCWVVDARRGLDPFDAKAMRYARRRADEPERADAAKPPSLATARAVDEQTFIPAARSASGVVSAPDAWAALAAQPAGEPAASVPAPAAPAWELVFDDGVRVVASAHGLLGRNPAPGPSDPPGVTLIPLVDPSMEISKTHVAVDVDATGVWITDRASRNGTTVTTPGGTLPLEPGRRSLAMPGARVDLGGRHFTIVGGARA